MTWLRQLVDRALPFLGTRAEPQGFATWPLEGIAFAQQGLTAGLAAADRVTWTAGEHMDVELTRAARDHSLDDLSVREWLDQQRRLAAANGRGLVQADATRTASGARVLEVITKGARRPGYDYVATACCSDDAHTYTIRISAHEGATTGMREAVINVLLFQLGELRLPQAPPSPTGTRIEGWFVDPYDPAWDDTALRAISDDERADVVFPNHPLSRVRARLAQVRESLVLDAPLAPTQAADALEQGQTGTTRGVLSDRAVRELQWIHNCFDPIAATLRAALADLDEQGAGHDERAANCLLYLGVVQARQDQFEEAAASLGRAMTIFEAAREQDDVKIAAARGHLARALLQLGHTDRAVELFEQALPVLERLRPGHLVLAQVSNAYGLHLLKRSPEEARPYVLQANNIVESLGGGRRPFLLMETVGEPMPTPDEN